MLRGTKLALVGALVDLALAAGLGAIRATHGSTGESHVEGWLPTIAVMTAVGAPGILALVGIAIRRPVLWGGAGIACAPLIVVSIAAFPLVIPSVLLLVAFGHAQSDARTNGPATIVVLIGFAVPLVTGLWILITQTAQFTYNFPGGSESGEYFTPAHAVLCIALVVVDLVLVTTVAIAWTTPPAVGRETVA